MKSKVNKSAQIRELFDAGKSPSEIKQKLNCSSVLVSVVLRNYKKKLKKEKDAEKLYRNFHAKRSKIVKAVTEVKQALDALEKKPKKDSKALAWAKKNPWFGVSKPRTAYALGLHEELLQSGVDPKSDEYYKRIDDGMSVFPGKEKKKPTKLITQPQFAQAALDLINNPPHYRVGGVETIDFIEAKDLNYRLGNVVKYVSRAGKKGDPLQDLEKAAWYLQREITARKNA